MTPENPTPTLTHTPLINTSLQRGGTPAWERFCLSPSDQEGAGVRRRCTIAFPHPLSVPSVLSCLILLFLFTGCSKSSDSSPLPGSSSKKLTIALMPKSKGNAYFISCKQGADEAAKELGVELLFDGPTDPDPAKQNEIIENWIALGVDAIAAACENKEGISTALRKAKKKGIKVLTYDSDANPDARDFFVNQATPEGIGTIRTTPGIARARASSTASGAAPSTGARSTAP